MSLSTTDFHEIRTIIREEVKSSIEPLWNELKAMRNDIKEIYCMLAEVQSGSITDQKFKKLTLEQKLLTLNAELIATAKQAGIVLPRN